MADTTADQHLDLLALCSLKVEAKTAATGVSSPVKHIERDRLRVCWQVRCLKDQAGTRHGLDCQHRDKRPVGEQPYAKARTELASWRSHRCGHDDRP